MLFHIPCDIANIDCSRGEGADAPRCEPERCERDVVPRRDEVDDDGRRSSRAAGLFARDREADERDDACRGDELRDGVDRVDELRDGVDRDVERRDAEGLLEPCERVPLRLIDSRLMVCPPPTASDDQIHPVVFRSHSRHRYRSCRHWLQHQQQQMQEHQQSDSPRLAPCPSREPE